MSATDAALFERWQSKRDGEAFAEIVARYSGMVFGTCRRILRNDSEAEDAAQECFIALMRAQVEPSPTLGPWLYTVAVRRSLDRSKIASRRRQREAVHSQAQENVEAGADAAEILTLVDEAVAELPETVRSLVVGRFMENRTHVDLAAGAGISEATVRFRIEKGIEQVRGFLKKRGVVVSALALTGVMESQLAEAAPASMVAALGKLALGGALPTLQPVASVAAKTSLLKAVSLTKAGMFAAALLIVVSAASVGYFMVTPAVDSLGVVAEADVQAGPGPAPEAMPAVASVVNEPAQDAAPVKQEPEVPVAGAPAAKPQPAPCLISGAVYDHTGQPIAGARVTAATWYSFDYRSMRVWHGETDSAGRYTVEGILLTSFENSGDYYEFADVSVSAPEFVTVGKRIDLHEGEELSGVDFRLAPGATLHARLLDQSARPVAGAAIVGLSMSGLSSRGTANYCNSSTDANGVFTMGFRDEGICSLLSVSADGVECLFPAVSIGSPDSIDLRMTEPASLSGKITGADGSPASNVGVTVLARYAPDGGAPNYADSASAEISMAVSRHATTNQDGTYRVDGVPAAPDLFVQFYESTPPKGSAAPIKLFEKDAGPVAAGENKTWNCTLPGQTRTMTVRCRIVGESSGLPIPTTVWLKSTATEAFRFSEVGPGAVTGEESVTVLSTPGAYEVWPRYRSTDREEDRQKYGRTVAWKPGSVQTLELVLPDPFTMTIRVVDEAGRPIAGATVEAAVGSGIFMGRETDQDGRYSWNGFAPGVAARFVVSKEGYVKAESQAIAGESGATYPEETVVLVAGQTQAN